MISLARCIFILTLLFGFLNTSSTLEYETVATVYHKLSHHTKDSTRGEIHKLFQQTKFSHFDSEDALSSFDITKNIDENELYLVKIVDNENQNHVTKSFTKLVCK